MTGPLRLPGFRLLFSARAISYVGTYLAPIAVAFAILDNGGGATALAQVAMLAFGGVVGDRVPRAWSCVVWDTTLQRKVAPEKLARVASYGWMGAMVFLPAGYALAGPICSELLTGSPRADWARWAKCDARTQGA